MHRSAALRARYLFAPPAEPMADGAIRFEAGRITALGRDVDGPLVDLGNVAIIPGLVNAHAHLELSDIAAPLGRPGMPLPLWLAEVIAARRESALSLDERVARGLAESLRCGTLSVGDIVQAGWSDRSLPADAPRVTAFLEVLAPTAARLPAALAMLSEHLGSAVETADWRPGVSPHAPYSVLPELLDACVQCSARQRVPLAFHLAESPEEIELLATGGGPFRAFLESLGSWEEPAHPPGRRPLDLLRVLARAHRALVIHGNYLDDEEIAFLAAHAERMTVVYCPRTHAWFGHPQHPLERLLAAGAAVALGTDSRASSPDLNLLAEMRLLRCEFPRLPGKTILELGTRCGARALGLAEGGTLAPGAPADFAVVALADREAADPHDLLWDDTARVLSTWRDGRVIFADSTP